MKEYTNIKADDFYCVGAVLETILIRNNYTNYSQYAIINEFGLTITGLGSQGSGTEEAKSFELRLSCDLINLLIVFIFNF
jgi:hypothetical protein